MTTKQMLAVIVYIAAIVVPAGAVAARFGFETEVSLDSSAAALSQILTMSGAVLSGVIAAVLAGRLMSSDSEQWTSVIGKLFSESHKHTTRSSASS